jgi:hypothetical protein
MSVTAPPNGRTRENDVPLRFEPPGGQARRPRMSWVALGVVVVLASGVFGAVTLARVADRDAALVLAQPLERGEVVTDAHLRTSEIAVDASVPYLDAAFRDEVVGRAVAGPLPEGTLLTDEHLADGPLVPSGHQVVGLALKPGEYPVASLRPGDPVTVVRTPDPTNTTAGEDVAVLTSRAEVYAVEEVNEATRDLMISITAPPDVSPAIAAAAAQGRVRLVLGDPR